MDFPQETNAAPYNPLSSYPKGTTNEAYVNLTWHIALAKNEAAEEYLKVREDAKKKNKKAPWGSLGKILEKAKQKHELPSNLDISIETVRTRAKHGNCKVAHCGMLSPMEKVEEMLIQIILQLAKMQVPISCWQGLLLANSLISGKDIKEEVHEWKKMHCIASQGENNDEETDKSHLLGIGYW